MAERAIGRDIAPPDLRAKITGRARYAEDFRAEGMLFAKLLLSPMPHCRVRRIDVSAALAMEGVVDILTADDPMMPEINGVAAEAALTNEPLYEGEPVLAVAAVDETTAADAIEAIRVDFEPLPFVVDPLDSLRPGGPNARTDGNIQWREGQTREIREFKWTDADFDAAGPDRLPMGEPQDEWNIGDVEDGFADADLVLEETLLHQSLSHHPMEPRSCMAYWQNGKLYLHSSTQSTARTHAALANRLGMDQADIVLVTEFCGGGFGSKISGAPITDVPAVLSRKTGRPVMLRVTRYEENYIGRARPGSRLLRRWASGTTGASPPSTSSSFRTPVPTAAPATSEPPGRWHRFPTSPRTCASARCRCTPTRPRVRRSGLRAAPRSWPCSSPSWTRRRASWGSTGSISAE